MAGRAPEMAESGRDEASGAVGENQPFGAELCACFAAVKVLWKSCETFPRKWRMRRLVVLVTAPEAAVRVASGAVDDAPWCLPRGRGGGYSRYLTKVSVLVGIFYEVAVIIAR